MPLGPVMERGKSGRKQEGREGGRRDRGGGRRKGKTVTRR